MKRVLLRTLVSAAILALALGAVLAAAPIGWELRLYPENLAAQLGLDRQVLHGGKASGSLSVPISDEAGTSVSFYQPVLGDEYREKRVRFSAFVKTHETSNAEARSGAGLFLSAFGRDRFLAAANMSDRMVKGTTDWTRYEEVLDVPKDTVLLRVGITLRGPGQLWLDDVRMEIVGKDVPTTGGPEKVPEEQREPSAATQELVEAGLRTAPRQPVNLDFEQ
jgi:hypothetical protein